MMMIGIGMPMTQARMPFMVSLRLVAGGNVEDGGLVPGPGGRGWHGRRSDFPAG